ncbi:RNA polymerase sigma factor [Chitinophaga solisilvae]|uniref:RNA polymerase sigma factor n=1 Tax=Chitinophaga solisilvae TaxID=1233460 RepID=UPI0013694A1A|nr:sigma-70 family RNA polymerase sigma factor [Chitinophaga solisilvae]
MFITDDPSFDALYRDTLPKVARMVRQMGGDLQTAKDLFHDAVIIYLEKKQNNTLKIAVTAQAYIMGIAKILCIRKLKADQRETDLDTLNPAFAVPDDYYTPPPVRRPVLEYLKTAGSKCLQLLQAFYYDKKTMQDIAASFHYKTPHTAAVQKYKCLEKVREQIKQTRYEDNLV